MDKEKVKLIVRNLELLIDSLKAEIYSDPLQNNDLENSRSNISDYDEIYDEDDDEYTYK